MKKIIIANWKMNPLNLTEVRILLNGIKKFFGKKTKFLNNKNVIICPPFVFIPFLNFREKKVKIGAQNCFWEEKGAFTGEISPLMLKNFGVEYVILGHSERRQILNETDEMINKKIKMVLKLRLNPILCIGETKEEKERGTTFEILQGQLKECLKDLGQRDFSRLLIAYEPVWAIGSGNPCQPEQAKEVLNFIKEFISANFSVSKKIPILYGGSVNRNNAKDYVKIGFNGLLVGGASLKPEEFLSILVSI